MIDNAYVDIPFEATADHAPTGLVGTITVEIYDPLGGGSIVAPTTVGITEPRPGTYRTLLTSPSAGAFKIRWTYPDAYAEEDLIVGGPVVTIPPGRPARIAAPSAFPSDDDGGISASDDLAAAVASRLRPSGRKTTPDEVPLGRTWLFDHALRRFVRSGIAPVAVTGLDAAEVWAVTQLHLQRDAHPAVTDGTVGVDGGYEPLGGVVDDGDLRSQEDRWREALLVHERFVSVPKMEATLDESDSTVIRVSFEIDVDGAGRLPVATVIAR